MNHYQLYTQTTTPTQYEPEFNLNLKGNPGHIPYRINITDWKHRRKMRQLNGDLITPWGGIVTYLSQNNPWQTTN